MVVGWGSAGGERLRWAMMGLVMTLAAGCYRVHERPVPSDAAVPDAAVPDAGDPVRPALCPAPPGGDGRQLLILHERDGVRSLTRRDADGTDHLLATFLPQADEPYASLVVSPGGDRAYAGSVDDFGILIDVASGDYQPITLPRAAHELCERSRSDALPMFRADGHALLINCSASTTTRRGERLEAAGVWELDLRTMIWREIAADCASAHYTRASPCDTKVDWYGCPGPATGEGLVRSELRPLEGLPRPLPAISWALSASSYLEVRETGGALDQLLVVDPSGGEHQLSQQIDLGRPLSWDASALTAGAGLVFAPDVGWVITDPFGQLSAMPETGCAAGDEVFFPSYGPDGDFIVWQCVPSSRRWYATDLRAGGRVSFPQLAGVSASVRHWSADGRYMLLQLAPADDGQPRAIVVSRNGERVLEVDRGDPALGRILDVDLAHPARWY